MPKVNKETIEILRGIATQYSLTGAQLHKQITNFERDPSRTQAKILGDYIEGLGDESIPSEGFLVEGSDDDQGTTKADG